MLTNFEKVCEFNRVFGLPHFDKKQKDIDTKLFKLRVDLCLEEVDELNEAFINNDIIEVIDALTDEAYVIYGLASSFGINLDDAFKKCLKEMYFLDHIEIGSNFELVKKMMNLPNTPYYFLPDKPTISKESGNLLLETIHKQVDKLKFIHNWNDYVEDLCYLLYYVYKMAIISGIDLDKAFEIVHDSNMSKLCITEDEAIDTVEHYKKNDTRYDSPQYRKSEGYWVIYNESTGKILKSINYIPAKFNTLL